MYVAISSAQLFILFVLFICRECQCPQSLPTRFFPIRLANIRCRLEGRVRWMRLWRSQRDCRPAVRMRPRLDVKLPNVRPGAAPRAAVTTPRC